MLARAGPGRATARANVSRVGRVLHLTACQVRNYGQWTSPSGSVRALTRRLAHGWVPGWRSLRVWLVWVMV